MQTPVTPCSSAPLIWCATASSPRGNPTSTPPWPPWSCSAGWPGSKVMIRVRPARRKMSLELQMRRFLFRSDREQAGCQMDLRLHRRPVLPSAPRALQGPPQLHRGRIPLPQDLAPQPRLSLEGKVQNNNLIYLRFTLSSTQDKECVSTVMEVVEHGISGSKSRNRASDEPIFKENKTLSPASRRVREAAEALLSCILEQVCNS